MSRIRTRHPGVYYRLDAQGRRRYIVWFRDSNGRERFKTLPMGTTEKDAVAHRADLTSRMRRGEKIAPSNLRMSDWADQWLEEQDVAEKTLRNYRWAVETWIKPKLGHLKVHEVTVDDVAWYISELRREGKAAWTIRACMTPLNRMMAVAARRGHCPANPCRLLDKTDRPRLTQRKMRVLTPEEIKALLEAAPNGYRAILATLVFTGMRIGEALALEWEDVDFHAGLIRVKQGKTENAAREIVLMPSLRKTLLEHRLAQRPSRLVFCSAEGKPLDRRSVAAHGLLRATERASLGHVRLHELRHTFASILIGQGMDVTYVADQLGHSSPQVTLTTYAKLFDPAGRREEARNRLELAFGKLLASAGTT